MLRRTVVSVLALVPVVIGASVVAIVGLWGARACIPDDSLAANEEIVGTYLQILGTVYAVLLAFVTQTVWTQFNETRGLIDQEANEIIDLFRAADGFSDADRIPIQRALVEYVERVIRDEWRAMARPEAMRPDALAPELDRVWEVLHVLEPTSACSTALHAEALGRYNDLTNARTHRLTAAHTRIPFPLKVLLAVGAVLMVASMSLFHVESFALHAVMTGAVAGAVSHVLYLVWDLDNPFSGAWRLSSEPFDRVLRYVSTRTRPTSP